MPSGIQAADHHHDDDSSIDDYLDQLDHEFDRRRYDHIVHGRSDDLDYIRPALIDDVVNLDLDDCPSDHHDVNDSPSHDNDAPSHHDHGAAVRHLP